MRLSENNVGIKTIHSIWFRQYPGREQIELLHLQIKAQLLNFSPLQKNFEDRKRAPTLVASQSALCCCFTALISTYTTPRVPEESGLLRSGWVKMTLAPKCLSNVLNNGTSHRVLLRQVQAIPGIAEVGFLFWSLHPIATSFPSTISTIFRYAEISQAKA